MSEQAWAYLTAVSLAVLAAFGWLARRLLEPRLTPEVKAAVVRATEIEQPPANMSDAILALALQLGELQERDNAWSIFAYELERWGLRGWERAEPPREPIPQRPAILRPHTPGRQL